MPLTPRPAAGAVWPILCAALATLECGPGPAPIAIRLVDTFRPELVLGRSPASSSPLPRTEWRVDAAPAGGRGPPEGGGARPGAVGLAARDRRPPGPPT